MRLTEFINSGYNNSEGVIYKIQNMINGKIYIGQTRIQLIKRLRKHLSDSRPTTKSTKHHLQRALFKYGFQNFDISIVETCPIELLNNRETFWIKFFNSTDPKIGYNCTLGGESPALINGPSQEARRKSSITHKKKWENPEYRKRMLNSRKGCYKTIPVVFTNYSYNIIDILQSKQDAKRKYKIDYNKIKDNHKLYSKGGIFMTIPTLKALDLRNPLIVKLDNNYNIVDFYYTYKDANLEIYKLTGKRAHLKREIVGPRNKIKGCNYAEYKWMLYSDYLNLNNYDNQNRFTHSI